MSLFAALALAAVSTNLVLGAVVLQRHRLLANRMFFLFCVCLATWSLSVYVLTEPDSSAGTALVWARILVSAAAVAPTVFLHVVLLNFGEAKRRVAMPAYVTSAVLVLMTLSGLTVGSVRPLTLGDGRFGWYGVASPVAVVVPLFAATASWLAISVLYQNARHASGIRRGQATYLLVAITPALVIGLHDLVGLTTERYFGSGVSFMPLFPLASIVWTTLGGYAIMRHRLMDLDAALLRGLGEALLFAFVLIPMALALIAAQRAYFGRTVPEFSAVAITICTAATLAFPLLRALLRAKLGSVLVRRATSYRQALFAFSNEAARILDLERLIDRVNQALTKALRVEHAAVYVAESAASCRLGGARGTCSRPLPERLTGDSALFRWLSEHRSAVVREELELAADGRPAAGETARAMSDAGIEVAVPMSTPEGFEGFAVLGPKENRAMFSEEDIEVLTILANQLSTAMSNAQLYADLKRSQELIQRSDRLSAIGTMAAGLAHEIRNPLVSIRTFTQLLPERVNDEEFRSKFFDLTLSEVDRICALVSELLAFARPAPAQLQSVDINGTLDRICLLLESQARNRGVSLTKQFQQDLAYVTVDEDQIKQVAMNIVLNAIQACKDGGAVEVRTRHGGKDDAYVCIEVSDTGRGIDAAVAEQIFDPFFTTRSEGTGLGLSIAHQIVTRHGGYIDVRSQPERGTAFMVFLPVDSAVVEEAADRSPEEALPHG